MARSFQNVTQLPAPRADARRIEDGINDDVLRFTFLGASGLSFLYAAAIVAHLLVLSGEARALMVPVSGISAALLVGLSISIARGIFPVRRAHMAAFAVFMVILVNSGLMLWVTEEMMQSTNFMLMIAVVGFVMLRRRWLVGTLAIAVVLWTVIVITFMSHDNLVHYSFGIGMATLAALLISLARRRTVVALVTGRIASDRQAIEVERLSSRLQAVVESTLDGICSLDSTGRTMLVNAAAAQISGRTAQEMIGTGFHDAVGHVDQNGRAHPDPCPVTVVARGGNAISVRGDRFTRPNGTHYSVEFTAAPLAGPAGEADGAVVVFRDISAAVATEKLKDDFVANVSHELRTPLTSIGGALRLLASGAVQDPSATENLLRISISSTERLVRLVEQILDIDRIESGRLELEFQPCDTSEMVSNAVNSVLGAAIEAGIEIHQSVESVTVEADHDRIVQVLVNLIGNAIKFSTSGSSVAVSAIAADQSVVFSVVDHGRGIPEDRIPSLFRRFEQVDSEESSRAGAGLGLAISGGIVAQHHGNITVQSRPGEGSTFRVVLPLRQPSVESSSG